MRYFIIFYISFLCLCASSIGFAATSFEPAFKTLGVWDDKTKIRIDVNIWYPTYSRPSPSNYAPWTLNVVRYGRSAKGRFPLLLLSHDTGATRFSYHETAAELAKSGFVVVAPDHKNDNLNHISYPFTIKQLTERAAELHSALDIALNHEAIRDSVDPNRVGIVGFGMGASAALLLGNAVPTPTGWLNYCAETRGASLYCNAWVRERIQQMANALPLQNHFASAHIKSVAAVAPSLSMFFTQDALSNFSAELLLVEAGADSVNLKPWNTEAMRSKFSNTTQFVRIDGADTTDFMAACPPELRQGVPELCGKATASLRREIHQTLNAELIKFFLNTLGHVRQ